MKRYNKNRPATDTEGIRAHLVRVYPDQQQSHLMSRHCGYRRVAYNWAIAIWHLAKAAGIWVDEQSLKKLFNECKDSEKPWCRELSQNASKNGISDAAQSIENYRQPREEGKKKSGSPNYAKRSGKERYRADNGEGTVKVKGNKVKLPKISGWIRMAEELRWDGDILGAHVKREAGMWFISFVIKTELKKKPKRNSGPVIGIDMGISVLAVITNLFNNVHVEIPNPRAWYAIEKKIRYYNKKLARSRKQHGKENDSNRRYKTKLALQKAHLKARNIRKEIIHQATTAVAQSAGLVCLEILNIDGMRRNRKLAKAVSDASMGEFIRQLEYKCELYGARLVRINRWYPSSQICSKGCGNRQKMSLDARVYRCQRCGYTIDRDVNAATNIAVQGIAESSFASSLTDNDVRELIVRGGVEDLADLLEKLGVVNETDRQEDVINLVSS